MSWRQPHFPFCACIFLCVAGFQFLSEWVCKWDDCDIICSRRPLKVAPILFRSIYRALRILTFRVGMTVTMTWKWWLITSEELLMMKLAIIEIKVTWFLHVGLLKTWTSRLIFEEKLCNWSDGIKFSVKTALSSSIGYLSIKGRDLRRKRQVKRNLENNSTLHLLHKQFTLRLYNVS